MFAASSGQIIVTLGRYIPQEDLIGDYMFGVGWAMLIQEAWFVKAVVTLGLMLVYEWNYNMSEFKHPALLWAVLTIAVWAAVYGPIYYQNLGAASRFRLQVLPLLLLVLLYLSRDRKAAPASPTRA